MGVGAAASEPGTLSILRHVYADRATRANALGVWSAVAGLALALGPVIGGALVGLSSWRAIFWFNLGIAALAWGMAVWLVPESSDPTGRRLDLAGMVLAVSRWPPSRLPSSKERQAATASSGSLGRSSSPWGLWPSSSSSIAGRTQCSI